MAINFFKNVTANLTTTTQTLYTSPLGYSGIVLLAQLSNITSGAVGVSLFVDKSGDLTSLVTDFEIPGNDSVVPLGGKLVLEAGQAVAASASANASVQITLSVLESQN